MKKVLLILLLCGLTRCLSASVMDTARNVADAIVTHFVKGEYKLISQQISPAYTSYYQPEVFERDWNDLTGAYGKYVQHKLVQVDNMEQYHFIACLIQLEYLPYVLNLTLDAHWKIMNLGFIAAHKTYVCPDYAPPGTFQETVFKFYNGMFEFTGNLTLPATKGPYPLVVMMGDAGPTDRDFTMADNRPYRDIAWGLAASGFAVYRYDKRAYTYGIYMQQKKNNYESFTCRDDYLDDLYKALDTLEQLSSVQKQRIYILGHGQSGMLLPLVAKERPEIKGTILMATNAKRLQETMIDQYAYLSKVNGFKKPEYDEQAIKAKRSLDKKLKPLTEHNLMPYDVPATYWIWLNKYDHLKMAKKQVQPMLIMQAEKDYQVSNENYDLWKSTLAKKQNVTFHSYPKLNHLFFPSEGESTYSEYFIKANVPLMVIEDLRGWLRAN